MIDALWIALGGMAIVFACLGILLLVMMGLSRVFRVKEGTEEQ